MTPFSEEEMFWISDASFKKFADSQVVRTIKAEPWHKRMLWRVLDWWPLQWKRYE